MTLVRGHKRSHQEYLSVASFVALSVAPPNFSPSPESGDKLSDQPAGPLETKPSVADAPVAATNVSKYSEDDLQRILKVVLEA